MTFFPPRHRQDGTLLYARARRICANCDVINECLRDCLANEGPGHRYGMRAGMSPKERDGMKVRVLRCVICETEVTVESGSRLHVITCSDECYAIHRRAQKYESRVRTA